MPSGIPSLSESGSSKLASPSESVSYVPSTSSVNPSLSVSTVACDSGSSTTISPVMMPKELKGSSESIEPSKPLTSPFIGPVWV